MGKVVLLIRNAAKGDFGGAETYPVSLATLLQQNDYHPIIVSRSRKLLTYADQHSIPTVRSWWWSQQNWSGWRVLLTPLYVLWQLALTVWYIALILRTNASVLHIQSKDDFIAATLAAGLTGRQSVWTDHMDLRYIFQNIAEPLRNPVGKLVFWAGRFANHIILISDNEYRLITGQFKHPDGLKKQIVIVKNGVVDKRDAYPVPQKHAGFSFCLTNRMVETKGVDEAIRAFMLFKARAGKDQDVRLDIYGDGPEMGRFKALAKPEKAIIFHGHQSDALKKTNEADVFMLPSHREGFSIGLLEATMLGKAIVATNVDSNPEIITNHESGLLVPPKDPAALADAMYTLYHDEALRLRLGKEARKQYEQSFNLTTILQHKIIPLYEDSPD